MTSKIILGGLIAIAFVAGSIATGSVASAAQGGQGDNLIIDAINALTAAVQGIEPTVTVDQPITINAPQGPTGEQGEQGPPGEQGEQGPPGEIGEISFSGSNSQGGGIFVLDGIATSQNLECQPGSVVTGFEIDEFFGNGQDDGTLLLSINCEDITIVP